MPIGLDPVQYVHPERRGQVAIGRAGVIDLGDQLGERHLPAFSNYLQLLPERFLQRKTGAVAVQGR